MHFSCKSLSQGGLYFQFLDEIGYFTNFEIATEAGSCAGAGAPE